MLLRIGRRTSLHFRVNATKKTVKTSLNSQPQPVSVLLILPAISPQSLSFVISSPQIPKSQDFADFHNTRYNHVKSHL